MEKISTVHSSRDLEYVASGKEPEGENVCRDGLDNLKEAEEKGYETLLEGSKKVWEKIWKKQDIQIDSKEDDAQIAVRFALYHLQIMVRSEDNRVGIGAKALSGEGYKGHSCLLYTSDVYTRQVVVTDTIVFGKISCTPGCCIGCRHIKFSRIFHDGRVIKRICSIGICQCSVDILQTE